MNRKKSALLLFVFALLFAACGRSAPQEYAASEAAMAPEPASDMAFEMEEAAVEEAMVMRSEVQAGNEFALAQEGVQERLIIRTADMSIVVTDTEEAMATIADMANNGGGWVVSSGVFQYDENAKTGNMTVRIPAQGFQAFIDAIQGMSVEVTRISTSGQDVTEEYVDLSARLANLEATADRVRNFLDEAKDVEDALAVNQELSRLEGEIEVLKGRINYLERSAAYSTVSIDLTPDILSQPIEVGGWQPQGVAKTALESLISALQTLVDIAIWFVIFLLPILIIIAIPILILLWLIRRWRRRRKARKEAQVEPVAQEPEETQESDQQ